MSLPEAPRRKSIWRTFSAVAWGFFGVRKNSAFQEDVARLTPLHVVGAGLIAAILFVVALIVVVNYVAAP